jgi:hypothetical protein
VPIIEFDVLHNGYPILCSQHSIVIIFVDDAADDDDDDDDDYVLYITGVYLLCAQKSQFINLNGLFVIIHPVKRKET